jgi:hypothetical protein
MENRIDIAKANQIVQEYGLAANTVKVWNSRGAIPKKYLDGTAFKKEGKISVREMDRLIEVLGNDKINLNQFFRNCETIKSSDYHDYVKIGAQIDRVQYNEIRKVLNKLRTEMKRLTESKNFAVDLKKWMGKNPELKKKLLLDQRSLFYKQGKVLTIDEEFYQGRLAIFLLESSLI